MLTFTSLKIYIYLLDIWLVTPYQTYFSIPFSRIKEAVLVLKIDLNKKNPQRQITQNIKQQ